VETPEIEGEIERAIYASQAGDITHGEGDGEPGATNLALGDPDRPRREVEAGHLPTVLGERHSVRARAASEVDGPTRRMGGHEIEKLWRRDSGVPGRTEQVAKVEFQSPEQGLAFVPRRRAGSGR
jgi:hypothetical protein